MNRSLHWRRSSPIWVVLLLLFCTAPLLGPRSAYAEAAPFNRVRPPRTQSAAIKDTEIVSGELVVRVQPGLALKALGINNDHPAFGALLGQAGTLPAAALSDDTYLVNVGTDAHVADMVAQFAANPAVAYAEPVYRWHLLADRSIQRNSNDPLVSQQWPIAKIQAPQAWDVSVGADSLVIASLDTGVNAHHPDLVGRVLPGYNFVSNNTNTNDDESHGTFTAGIMAAAGDNGVGVAGMCWRCRILPVKVLNNKGEGTNVEAAMGIRWAVDHGARVINMSLGGPHPSQFDHDAIQYAVSKGVVVIAASGNEAYPDNPVEYPAAYDEVYSVGATDINDVRAVFSNYGPYLDISAPGVDIVSSGSEDNLNGYNQYSGTSFASPYVSGLAALLLSINPQLNDKDVLRIISQTADDLGTAGPDDYYGFGRINAGRAAQAVQATLAPAPPATGQAITFPETNHTLAGTFLDYWKGNGGLPVFGFPITEQHPEVTADGSFQVQYLERNRFEYHPEKQAPYNVLLGRLGDTVLKQQGRDWFTFPKAQPGGAGCQFFAETQHAVCGTFLQYWQGHGLNDPKLDAYGRSLQLFGLPLSEPMMETNSSGDHVMTQWFERARFEDHGTQGVLLGLLGDEFEKGSTSPGVPSPAPGTTPPPPPPPSASADCNGIVAPISGGVLPANCVKQGTPVEMNINGFQPNEEIAYWLTGPDGAVHGGTDTINVGATGQTDGLEWDTAKVTPGLWFWVFAGKQSKHQAIIYIKVLQR
ncbi:MAG: S8 family serine peptidase [Herpetosiphonaceae bacterium]|nr:S8 family serine peptidase [Herpetosiphonaceae bacterium]